MADVNRTAQRVRRQLLVKRTGHRWLPVVVPYFTDEQRQFVIFVSQDAPSTIQDRVRKAIADDSAQRKPLRRRKRPTAVALARRLERLPISEREQIVRDYVTALGRKMSPSTLAGDGSTTGYWSEAFEAAPPPGPPDDDPPPY